MEKNENQNNKNEKPFTQMWASKHTHFMLKKKHKVRTGVNLTNTVMSQRKIRECTLHVCEQIAILNCIHPHTFKHLLLL